MKPFFYACRGPNDESFGPRFFALNGLYDSKLRELARQAAEQVGSADAADAAMLMMSMLMLMTGGN